MSKEGTAKTLVLVAGILSIIGFVISLVGALVLLFLTAPAVLVTIAALELIDPLLAQAALAEFMFAYILSLAGLVMSAIFGLIFGILWLVWRKDPARRKIALIVTGVISIVFAVFGYIAPYATFAYYGFVPGILAIVGGAIASKGA